MPPKVNKTPAKQAKAPAKKKTQKNPPQRTIRTRNNPHPGAHDSNQPGNVRVETQQTQAEPGAMAPQPGLQSAQQPMTPLATPQRDVTPATYEATHDRAAQMVSPQPP